MRSIAALLLLALVSSSWAVQIADSIPMVKRAEVPRMLLSEIAAMLTAEGPLGDIAKLFDTLESQIRKEQVEHDSLSARQHKECKAERDFRKKEIADAASAVQRATDEKNACSSSLHQNRQALKSNQKTQKDVNHNIEILVSARKAEKAVFDSRHRNLVAAISSVDQAHKILQGLYSGSASLIDLSRATVGMFQLGVANSNAHHYTQVIGALAQLSMNTDLLIDNNILARVEDLFKILREKIADELKAEETAESKSIARFEKAKGDLDGQVKKLKSVEKRLRDQIANNQNCIVKASNIIAIGTNKKERNQNLLNDAEKMCKNFESEYKTATAQRKEELQLVEKIRDLTNSKLKFSKLVTKRADENKNQFKKYVNKAKIPKGRRGHGGGKKKTKLVEVAEKVETPVEASTTESK